MKQIINQPTNFTESSQSIIDLFFISSTCVVKKSGVGEPFLGQNIRYHCPVFCCLSYTKPVFKPFKRIVWNFNEGNYAGMRQEASNIDWDSLHNTDIDMHANDITQKILNLAKKIIPNKTVTIRQSDPPWIRKRKRAYDKAIRT